MLIFLRFQLMEKHVAHNHRYSTIWCHHFFKNLLYVLVRMPASDFLNGVGIFTYLLRTESSTKLRRQATVTWKQTFGILENLYEIMISVNPLFNFIGHHSLTWTAVPLGALQWLWHSALETGTVKTSSCCIWLLVTVSMSHRSYYIKNKHSLALIDINVHIHS